MASFHPVNEYFVSDFPLGPISMFPEIRGIVPGNPRGRDLIFACTVETVRPARWRLAIAYREIILGRHRSTGL